MAIIPQVITEDRASGAQVIDGSLKFDSTAGDHLLRTPSTSGNRRVWTWSGWVKRQDLDSFRRLFEAGSSTSNFTTITWQGDNNSIELMSRTGGTNKFRVKTARLFRDLSAWYHVVVSMNILSETQTDRCKIYINGERITDFDDNTQQNNVEELSFVNGTDNHFIGSANNEVSTYNGYMSQVYLIDGIELDPSYFGFTDPLTGTWRPKKYTGDFNYVSPVGQIDYESGFDGNSFQNPDTTWLPFVGNTSNSGYSQSKNTTLTYTAPGSGIAYTSTIRLFCKRGSGGANSITVDGNSFTPSTGSGSNTGAWNDISSYVTGGVLNTIVTSRGSSGRNTYWSAIEVDGVILTHLQPGYNGFYLPFDGNSPIGEDKSGNGNNYGPVNFGGSNTIEKATGALPILNTVNGGTAATADIRTDAYASNLVLALPLIGNTDDISHLINNGSTQKTVATKTSVDASSLQSNFYGGSHRWNANSDFLSYSEQGNELVLGTGDFTVECWVYDDNSHNGTNSRCYIWDNRVGGSVVSGPIMLAYIDGHQEWNIEVGGNSLIFDVGPSYTTERGNWHHLAATRESGTIKMWLDGVEKASNSNSSNITTNGIGIGCADTAGYGWAGYIQDFRIYKGVAKYTSNFIPASTNPDILPDTPSGVAYSSELTKITDGAVAFDGSGDFLALNDSSDFSFGGDFTVEAFVYQTVQADHKNIFSTENFDFKIRGNGKVRIYTASSGTDTTQTVPLKKWTHLALVRESGTIKVYFDGVGETVSQTITSDGSSAAEIGRRIRGSQEPFNGFISNLRVVKGTALYTSDFTPPTEPLTEVTNTKLLCCQSMTSSVAAAVTPATITANGNAVATNFNPFNDDINTVRGQESLYCTLNPLEKNSKFTLSENNLKFTNSTNNWTGWIGGTQTFKTGKWYWEVRIDVSTQYHIFGIVNTTIGSISAADTYQYAMAYQTDGRFYAENNGTASFSTGNPTAQTVGDICSIAVDMDNKKMWLGINGQWIGGANPSIGYLANWDSTRGFTDGDTYMPVFMSYGSSGQTVNFGQKPFRFTPPDGFQPLCLNNLPRPTKAAVRPDKHFKTMVWSGDNTTRSMTGLGFIPDLVWIKCRNLAAFHNFTDSIRGPKVIIQSNTTTGEQKPTTHNGAIDSFDPDGFTLGTGLSYGDVNQSGRDYVGWAWKGGTPENYTTPCGSVLFDGSGDYLSLPVSSDFQFGSGDFTIECWAKAYDQGTDDILGIYNTGDNRRTFALRKDQTESVQFFYSTNGSSGASASSSADVIKLGTWHHYAVVRDNLVYKIYLDGVLVATDSSSTDAIYTNNDDGLRIGSSYNTDFDGHISNVRIIKGTALYTSNFTPPTEPLTNVTNTKLLCCQSATSPSAATVAPGTFVNAGTNYSSNNQVTGSAGLVGADSIFNGHLKDAGVPTLNEGATVDLSSDNYILWTPTTGIPYNSKVEVFCYAPNGYGITTYYTFNGGTETSFVGGGANYNGNTWITVATGSGTINSIKLRLTRSPGQSRMGWYAIRVDGTILLNDQNGKSIGRYDNATPTTHNPFDMYRVDGRVYATAAEAGLNGGTITPTGASVNTDAGFSIITYTGNGLNDGSPTVGHGLGKSPSMIFIKNRDASVNWDVHLFGTVRMTLNLTEVDQNNGQCQYTDITFSLANNSANRNGSKVNYIAYCWAEIEGYSKFGRYEGTANGGTDGPFIECGFKPAWVLIKSIDVATSWYLFDDVRGSIQSNGSNAQVLFPDNPNVSDSANGGQGIDFLSNGFKVRSANGYGINNQVTYIYAAFAEAPTFNLYGGQANAR